MPFNKVIYIYIYIIFNICGQSHNTCVSNLNNQAIIKIYTILFTRLKFGLLELSMKKTIISVMLIIFR